MYIQYSRKLLREKTFVNFTVLWLFVKGFYAKLGGMHPLAWQKGAICESFFHENRNFHQFVKAFSLESFPLYNTSIKSEVWFYSFVYLDFKF